VSYRGLDDLDSRPLSDEGVWYSLRSPRDGRPILLDGKPLRLRIAGPDSKLHRDMLAATARRVASLRINSPDGEIDPDKLRRVYAEELAKIVLAWEGFYEADGTEAVCDTDNVARLFTEREWAREQVDGFAASRANFFPSSEAASSPASSPASDATST
jgi:hypothetical protein